MGRTKPNWPASYFEKKVPWYRKLFLKVQSTRDFRAIIVKDIAKERNIKEEAEKKPYVHLKCFPDDWSSV